MSILLRIKLSEYYDDLLLHVPPYIQGETNFSYLNRLALSNALPRFEDFYSLTHEGHKHRHLSLECLEPEYLDVVNFTDPDKYWFRDSSLYGDILPFLSRSYMNRKILYLAYGAEIASITGRDTYLISESKVCPECIKEDNKSGSFHLRKIHQIPGVSVCPKHGCTLLSRSNNKFDWEHPFDDIKQYHPITPTKWKQEDSLFLEGICISHIERFLDDTSAVLNTKLKAKYGKKVTTVSIDRLILGDSIFKDIDTGEKAICSIKNVLYSKVNSLADIQHVVPFIRVLYKNNSQDFIKDLERLPSSFSEGQIISLIPDNYEMNSSFSAIFFEIQNKNTGIHFPMTPQALIDGLPMPDMKKTHQELLDILLKRRLGNEWEILSPIPSRHAAIELQEKRTGDIFISTLHKILNHRDFGHIKLNDSNKLQKYAKLLDGHQDYNIISTKGIGNMTMLHIMHNVCGNNFWAKAEDFISYPYCHVCHKDAEETNVSITEQIRCITAGLFIWTGNISEEIFSARMRKKKYITIEAINCTELIRKLKSDKDGTKQEKQIIKAIEFSILNTIKQDPSRIFLKKDFQEYGASAPVKIAISNLSKKSAINVCNEMIWDAKSKFSFEEIIDRYFQRINGIPIGDTLLRLSGMKLTHENTAYFKYGSTSNIENMTIGNTEITIVHMPIRITRQNKYKLSLLVTLEHKELMHSWGNTEQKSLSSWAKANIRMLGKPKSSSIYFSNDTIEEAINMLRRNK